MILHHCFVGAHIYILNILTKQEQKSQIEEQKHSCIYLSQVLGRGEEEEMGGGAQGSP